MQDMPFCQVLSEYKSARAVRDGIYVDIMRLTSQDACAGSICCWQSHGMGMCILTATTGDTGTSEPFTTFKYSSGLTRVKYLRDMS